MWPMVAFATAVLLNLLSMAMERRPVKRQLCFLNVYISGARCWGIGSGDQFEDCCCCCCLERRRVTHALFERQCCC